MEQRKPRNRKGGNKSVKRKDEIAEVVKVAANNPSDENSGVSSGIKKLTPKDYDYVNSDKSQFAHLKRETQQAEELEKQEKSNSYSRRKVISNWGAYEEIGDSETLAKDFKSLLNVPISEGGHFVFKSEKNWAIEVTKYSDFFSLNVKKLAGDINCIPFCEYIDVDEKYFTVDQLTRFQNLAEKSRSLPRGGENNSQVPKDDCIDNIIDILKVEIVNEAKLSAEIQSENRGEENTEEDLDFLLSLKEPVEAEQSRIAPSINPIYVEDERSQPSSSAPVKSIDLEKWLDSILDS